MLLLALMTLTPAWKTPQVRAHVQELAADKIVSIQQQIKTIWLGKATREIDKQERFTRITAEFQLTLSKQSRLKVRTVCNQLPMYRHQLVVALITFILWRIWYRTQRSIILNIQNSSKSSTSSCPIQLEWSTFLRWMIFARKLSPTPNSWTSQRKSMSECNRLPS